MAESGCKCGFAMVHGSLSKFRRSFRGLARAVIAGLSLATSDNAGEAISGADAAAPVLNAREVRRFPVPDAFQGVAVNGHAFYAISNTQITKYDKASGRRLANWSDPSGDIVHLNSCAIRKAILVCAHSNYPDSPTRSSIEIFDIATLKHVGHRSLGITPGALTWADWHEGAWWLCYATYGGFAQDPYKAGSSTTIVRYDERWRRRETWLFPTSVSIHSARCRLQAGPGGRATISTSRDMIARNSTSFACPSPARSCGMSRPSSSPGTARPSGGTRHNRTYFTRSTALCARSSSCGCRRFRRRSNETDRLERKTDQGRAAKFNQNRMPS